MADGEAVPQRYHGAAVSSSAGAIVTSTSSGTSLNKPVVKRFTRNEVPDSVLHNEGINAAIASLPANYNFEIHKTVWRLQQAGAKQVGA